LYPYVLNRDRGLSIIIGSEPYLIPTSDDRFEKLVEAINAADLINIERLVKNPITEHAEAMAQVDGVTIFYGRVELHGQPIQGYLTDLILRQARAGHAVTPLARFLEKVNENPSHRAVEDLYKWVEANNMPITNDGCIIAYKIVRNDFKDCHSGKFDNSPGQTVSMPRNQVDENPNQTCSKGLHGCGPEYLPEFGPADQRVVIIKVSPADMVAFPKDYNLSKFRCCRYEVLHEVPRERAAKFFETLGPTYDPLPADFSAYDLVRALITNDGDLADAFDYRDTPEGRDYWSYWDENLVALDEEPRAKLQAYLDTYIAKEAIGLPEDFDRDLAIQVLFQRKAVRISKIFDVDSAELEFVEYFEGLNWLPVWRWPDETKHLVACWIYLAEKEMIEHA